MDADRTIRQAAVSARTWSGWLDEQNLAPLRTDGTRRLAIVAPHPDDEVIACGALLALHLEAGGEALVVAVTDGEASHPGDPAWPPDRLRRVRREESAKGLRALGGTRAQVVRLSIADGGVALQPRRLRRQLLLSLRPGDLVVTTWRHDGHPDHECTGETVALACASLGCELLEAPVWMWHWAQPGQADVPWQRLRTVTPMAGALARKQRALECHKTQLAPRAQGEPVLGAEILARAAWPREYYFVAEGAA